MSSGPLWLSRKNIGLMFFAVILIIIGVYGSAEYNAKNLRDARNRTERITILYGKSFEEILDSRLDLVDGLERFVLSRTDNEVIEDFDVFVSGLHNNITGVRNVGIAPGGKLTLIHPLRGNEQVLNYDLLTDNTPAVMKDIQEAIQSKSVVVSNPFQLRQGGVGIAARKAVYKNNALWGLVSVVIDVPAVIDMAGIAEDKSGIVFALRDETGYVFWDNDHVFEKNPVIVKINLNDESWDLAGVPSNGWSGVVGLSRSIFNVLVAVFSLLLWILFGSLLRKTSGLEMSESSVSERFKTLRVVGFYTIISLLWIVLSDRALLALFADPELISGMQTVKGFFFVAMSALVLYWLIELNYGKYLVTSRALRSVIEGNRLLMRMKSEKGLYEGVCEELVKISGYDMAWIGLVDLKEKRLIPVTSAGRKEDFFDKIKFSLGVLEPQTPCLKVINEVKPMIINDIGLVEDFPEWRMLMEKKGFLSMASLPLIDGESAVGLLTIYSSSKNAFTRGDLEVLKSFANDVIFGVNLIKNNKLIESQKERLETILKELGDAVYVTDKDGVLVMVNKELVKLMGEKESVLVGRKYSDIKLEYEKNGNNANTLIEQLLRNGKTVLSKESILHTKKDGNRINIELLGTPIFDASGAVSGCVVILRDVTHQHKQEQMKSDFVSLASHQLQSPLTAIKWFVGLLLEGVGKMQTGEVRKYIGKIGESSEKLIALVNDLLVTSRIEEGVYDERKLEKIKILDLMQSAYSMAEKIYLDKHIELQGMEQISSNLIVQVDKVQMVQVFNNLLSNAATYSSSNSKVRVSAEQTNNEVVVSIKDEGVGIPQKQQKNIFEKFFRADNVTSNTSGTGLGLYMTKNIIDGHGGEIWFASKEGKGTTFFVKLLIKQKNG